MTLMNLNFCSEDATNITTSSSDINFPSSNLKNPMRSKRWRSTGVTSEWVVFDLITTTPIDSVVLLWPKEDGITLSSSAVLTIQANPTNVWTSPALSQVLTINNTYEIASFYWTSDQSYRYWRLTIQDPFNPNGYVELGVCWLGKGIAIQDAQNGFLFDVVDGSVITRTPFGNEYVDQYPIYTFLTVTYQYMSYTDVQTLENAFRINGTKKPIMMVLDPTGATFDKDHFQVYGRMMADITWTHVTYNLLNSPSMIITETA